MIYVLLTDSDDSTALVACPDPGTAETVGAAAVMGEGGVSAWLVPAGAITDIPTVLRILREGGDCEQLLDADPTIAPRDDTT